jgi:DNA-binding CsgD family transcriptional regulator
LWLLRGEALLALRRHEEGRELLEAGVKRAEEEGQMGMLWRLLVGLGRAYRQSGKGEEAASHWQRARDLVAALAEKVPEGQLREEFVREAGAMVPAMAPTQKQAEKSRFGGLTAREREVAALIAQGMSNREIAEALIVGTRTVETYVTNILSKLGLQSRSQIAVWAVENGLTRKG